MASLLPTYTAGIGLQKISSGGSTKSSSKSTSGASSSAVRDQQKALIAAGANIKADGIWGPKTQAAYNQYGGVGNTSGGGYASAGGTSGWNVSNPYEGSSGNSTSTGPMGYAGIRPRTAIDIHGGVHQGLERGDTVYDAATRQLQHRNGYVGEAEYRNGRYYTPYNALIREDSIYTPGARLSPNGMYEDTGYGYVGTNYAGMIGKGGFRMAVPGDMQTMAPNQQFPYSDELLGVGQFANAGGGGSGGAGGAIGGADTGEGATANTGVNVTTTNPDEELMRYWRNVLGY